MTDPDPTTTAPVSPIPGNNYPQSSQPVPPLTPPETQPNNYPVVQPSVQPVTQPVAPSFQPVVQAPIQPPVQPSFQPPVTPPFQPTLQPAAVPVQNPVVFNSTPASPGFFNPPVTQNSAVIPQMPEPAPQADIAAVNNQNFSPVSPESASEQSAVQMPTIVPGYPVEKKSSVGSVIGAILLCILFFVLGVGATMLWQLSGGNVAELAGKPSVQALPTASALLNQPTVAFVKPTTMAFPQGIGSGSGLMNNSATPAANLTPPVVASISGWQSVTIPTKVGMPAISIQLPAKNSTLTCDTTACDSKGMLMDGGTKFTVAVHTLTTPMSSISGTLVTDSAGKRFTDTKTIAVSTKEAVNYQGTFAGTTSGNIKFSQMHGVMVLVNSTTTLEINHFAPSGKLTNFPADDAVFNQILGTVKIGN